MTATPAAPDRDAMLEEAVVHHQNGRIEEARAVYEAVLTADPDNVHALSVSAILLVDLDEEEEAIARLERALTLEPQNAALHNNLGNIHRQRGHGQAAYEAYRAAIRCDPRHVESICNLAVMVRANGSIGQALEIFREALEVDPLHVETNHNLGVTLMILGLHEDAADAFERCYAGGRIPVVDPSWHVNLLEHLGRHERALEIAEMHAAERPDDPISRHQLAAIRGEDVARAPDDYVRDYFDAFAGEFDTTLGQLDYRAPQLVAEQVRRLCGANRARIVVDLGCGTGLVGPLVRANAGTLIGVDLSLGMLAKAADREVGGKPAYDQLVEAELTGFLTEVPEGSIDLGISADTLCYFGALEEVLAGAHRAIRAGGAFVATFEQHEDAGDAGYKLLDSGRYGHSQDYVAGAATGAGFIVRGIHQVNLRKSYGAWVRGLLFILENGQTGT